MGGGCFVGYFWLFSGLVCLGLLFGVRFGSVLQVVREGCVDTVVWIVLGDLVSSACMRFMLAGFGWWLVVCLWWFDVLFAC